MTQDTDGRCTKVEVVFTKPELVFGKDVNDKAMFESVAVRVIGEKLGFVKRGYTHVELWFTFENNYGENFYVVADYNGKGVNIDYHTRNSLADCYGKHITSRLRIELDNGWHFIGSSCEQIFHRLMSSARLFHTPLRYRDLLQQIITKNGHSCLTFVEHILVVFTSSGSPDELIDILTSYDLCQELDTTVQPAEAPTMWQRLMMVGVTVLGARHVIHRSK